MGPTGSCGSPSVVDTPLAHLYCASFGTNGPSTVRIAGAIPTLPKRRGTRCGASTVSWNNDARDSFPHQVVDTAAIETVICQASPSVAHGGSPSWPRRTRIPTSHVPSRQTRDRKGRRHGAVVDEGISTAFVILFKNLQTKQAAIQCRLTDYPDYPDAMVAFVRDQCEWHVVGNKTSPCR